MNTSPSAAAGSRPATEARNSRPKPGTRSRAPSETRSEGVAVTLPSSRTRPTIRTLPNPRSVDESLVHELPQERPDRVGARRQQLGEEQHGELLRRVDEEEGAGCAAPGELSRRAGNAVGDRIQRHGEPQAEADPLERRLGEERAPDRLEVASAREVVAGHVADGPGTEDADAVQLPAPAEHLGEAVVVPRGGDESAAPGEAIRRPQRAVAEGRAQRSAG